MLLALNIGPKLLDTFAHRGHYAFRGSFHMGAPVGLKSLRFNFCLVLVAIQLRNVTIHIQPEVEFEIDIGIVVVANLLQGHGEMDVVANRSTVLRENSQKREPAIREEPLLVKRSCHQLLTRRGDDGGLTGPEEAEPMAQDLSLLAIDL